MTSQDSPNSPYRYVVTCPDNVQRHDETFDSIDAAVRFADYGHCCLTAGQHDITRTTAAQAARSAWQQQQLDKAASNMAAVLQTWDAPGYVGTAREIEMTLQLLAAARKLTLAATVAATTEDSSK
jgi:polyphosphate kinase 2 (PPK2 family)